MKIVSTVILSFFLLFSSCGYRFDPYLCSNRTIAVPFICGDLSGKLTSEVIREISSSGLFSYSNCDACYNLCIKIINCCEENIGFRYDDDKDGILTNTLVPIENRYTITVEIRLIECETGCTLLGPVRLASSIDYDHEYYSSQEGVEIDSLGQLTSIETARDTIFDVASKRVAEKIVDYLYSAW